MKTRLKLRKAKKSNRGIYMQDKQLRETQFKKGDFFRYGLDTRTKRLIILPLGKEENKEDYIHNLEDGTEIFMSKDDFGTVSYREMKDGFKPVIDIRKSKALAAFEGCDYLQVEIFEDEILLEGFVEEKVQQTTEQSISEENQENRNSLITKAKKIASDIKGKILGKKSNVVDINGATKLKRKVAVVLSRKELERAVGDQLSFTDFSWDITQSGYTSKSVSYIQSALKNIHIPLQVASLFSGAGIFDLGFKEAGFDIVFALEQNQEAAETYRHNFGDHIVVGDITKYDKNLITKAPVMIGGSPCQGFSNSNRYTNFLENPNNMLVNHYIDSIKANENCQVFVLENVPQILTAGNGQFKEEIYEALSDFEITSGKVKGTDFRGAQQRERAIFIGSKIGKIDLPKPIVEPMNYTTVGEAFEGLHNWIPNFYDYSKPKKDTVARMEHVPPGGNWMNIPDELKTKKMMTGETHSCMYRRLEWDKPSITIVNPRKAVITHPEENRILSVRECARLFGVPDTFTFKGSLSSMQQQVANSVPVQIGYQIAKAIKDVILKFNIAKRKLGLQTC